jgi:uncharacterized RDD family membrane protein YckC
LSARPASLGRRYLSILYESFPVAGLIWAAAFAYYAVEHALNLPHARPVFQAFLVAVTGAYFMGQWLRGGQTLAMKAWRLKLERFDGSPLRARQAIVRYAAALCGTLFFGITFLWAFIDRDGAFLHDRLARTRIVRI